MIILLAILFFILTVILYDDVSDIIAICLLLIDMICIITLIFLSVSVVNGRTLDSKIAIYEEENIQIETEMKELIKQSANYQSETYEELKGQNIIAIISLCSDLKENEFVQKEIKTYNRNKSQIIYLKEEKLELKSYKWWLYFGK